ncbi:MAG TPA: hypothetical protein ENN55_05965 [Firmicutes bacterium]|nr:hypothetical protein [Bacillota bacterium]
MKKRVFISGVVLIGVVVMLFLMRCPGPEKTPLGVISDDAAKITEEKEKVFKEKMFKKEKQAQERRDNFNIYIIEIDENGRKLREESIGTGRNEWAEVVAVTESGEIIIAGNTYDAGGKFLNNFIAKIGAGAGEVVFEEIGKEGFRETTADKGKIWSGRSYFGEGEAKELFAVKSDPEGNYEWIKTFGKGLEWGDYSIVTKEGSYITAGQPESMVPFRGGFFIVKRGEKGVIKWTKDFGGEDFDRAYAVTKDSRGNPAAAGITYSFGKGKSDIYFVKTDSDGNCIAAKTIGGAGFDEAYAICAAGDSDFIIAGASTSFGAGEYDAYAVRVDAEGNCLWAKTYGGSGDDSFFSVIKKDAGFLLTGITDSF